MMAALVDSSERELEPKEIIQIALDNTKSEYSFFEGYNAVVAELQMPNTLFIRQGNTLFIVHKAAPGVGFFRALNADTARRFILNSFEFIIAAYRMGFDTMVTEFEDPALLPLFEIISRNPPNDEMGYKAERTNTGFRVTIKTGPKRGGAK